LRVVKEIWHSTLLSDSSLCSKFWYASCPGRLNGRQFPPFPSSTSLLPGMPPKKQDAPQFQPNELVVIECVTGYRDPFFEDEQELADADAAMFANLREQQAFLLQKKEELIQRVLRYWVEEKGPVSEEERERREHVFVQVCCGVEENDLGH
jgi:hypothetical protein